MAVNKEFAGSHPRYGSKDHINSGLADIEFRDDAVDSAYTLISSCHSAGTIQWSRAGMILEAST
jgi:hypothetical protein